MGRLMLTADEAEVCEAVGVRSYVQARSLVASGVLVEVSWDPRSGHGRAVVRGERSGRVTASVVVGADGAFKSALQARKAELLSSVLDGGEFASAELTAADIRGLLD